jgi:hypothetical protein
MGEHGRRGAIGSVGLAKNVADMHRDRLLAEHEPRRNLTIGLSGRDEPQYLQFST